MSRGSERKSRFEISGGRPLLKKESIQDGQIVLFRLPATMDANALSNLEFTEEVLDEVLTRGGSLTVNLENSSVRLNRAAAADQVLLLAQNEASQDKNVEILHHGIFPMVELATSSVSISPVSVTTPDQNSGASPINLFKRVPVKVTPADAACLRVFPPTGYGTDAVLDSRKSKKDRKRKSRDSDDAETGASSSKSKKSSKKK